MNKLAENLLFYRGKLGLTQEQLAEKLEVSRQTISKWESGVSYPEMEKLLQLCDLFNCNMDLLLRGKAEIVNVEDHANYDIFMNKHAFWVATGVSVIILGLSAQTMMTSILNLSSLANATFLSFVLIAVIIFIVKGMQFNHFRKKHPKIKLIYTKDEVDNFMSSKFPIYIAVGVTLIFVGVIMNTAIPNGKIYNSIFLLLVAISVWLFVYSGIQKNKYDITLYNEENEFGQSYKNKVDDKIGAICGSIMLLAVISFLISGLVYQQWHINWIAFPIGGILCGIVSIIMNAFKK